MKANVLTLFLLLFVFEVVSAGQHETHQPGTIELTDSTKAYRLTGDWRFSRVDNPAFASPHFDDSSWEWIAVPGNWNILGLTGFQVAWYRFRFKLSSSFNSIIIGVRVPAILDSHEVYVNGTMIGGAGIINAEGRIVKKSNVPAVYEIPKKNIKYDNWNTLAIRVGDDIGWGGFETGDIFIGRSALLDWQFKKFIVRHSAVVIILAFLGVFFMLLYLWQHRDKVYLYLALLSICISLMFFSYYSFALWLIDNFWVNHFCFNTGVQIAIVFALYFIYTFFEYPADLVLKAATFVGCVLLGILILTRFNHGILRFYGNVSLTIALLFNAFGFIYLFFLTLKAILQNRIGAKIVGLGISVIIASFLNDIAGYLLALENERLGAEGMVVFMVCISFAVFLKNSKIAYQTRPSEHSLVLAKDNFTEPWLIGQNRKFL